MAKQVSINQYISMLKSAKLKGTSRPSSKNSWVYVDVDTTGMMKKFKAMTRAIQSVYSSKEIAQALAETAVEYSADSGFIPRKNKYQLKDPNRKTTKYGGSINQRIARSRKARKRKSQMQNARDYFNRYSKEFVSSKSAGRKKSKREQIQQYAQEHNYESQYDGYTKKFRLDPSDIYFSKNDDNSRNYWKDSTRNYDGGQIDHNSYITEKITKPVSYKNSSITLTTKKSSSTTNKYFYKNTSTLSKTRTYKKYYADRSPHLDEIDITHRVITSGSNGASISIHNRKPKDPKFRSPGGTEYAYAQYYADDANWNRETGGTARWLEVPFGLVQPQRDVEVDVNEAYGRFIGDGTADSEGLLNAYVIKALRKAGVIV